MAYEMKELSGSLFKNDKREKDTHPNMQGTCLINGSEYYISAWTKEGAKGKWISLAFKRKDGPAKAVPTAKPAPANEDFDDIPF